MPIKASQESCLKSFVKSVKHQGAAHGTDFILHNSLGIDVKPKDLYQFTFYEV